MRKFFFPFITLLFLAVFIFLGFAKADENKCVNPSSLGLEEIQKCLEELQKAKELSVKATKPLEDQLEAIKHRVVAIEQDLIIKKKNIDEGYKTLDHQQQILYRAIRDFYIKSYYNSPLLVFFSAPSASSITKVLAYQKAAQDQDKVIITNIVLSINLLETKKRNLEAEQRNLAVVKEQLGKTVGEAKGYQAKLSTQIAQLSQRQQEILAQRLASLNIPRSALTTLSGCIDDRNIDPGFSSALAFFTYGVPNRTGLNQYGAKGRADAGQNTETILRAYYNFDSIQDADTNININVEGYGSYSLEEYVKRIYEMPDSWPMEALKAQAIAARSYALAYTNNGAGSICASQNCQVFKPDSKGGNWEQAVNATAGDAMVAGGTPIKAWYSSTHGGFILSSSELPGWSATSWTKHAIDTTSGSAGSFQDLNSNAYDKDSPWFYCDWGARASYNKTAWLTSSEVADIVNILLLVKADSSTGEHLYQTDKPNPAGTDTWSEEKVKEELKKRGINPFNNVSDISVGADFGVGRTTNVNVSGDAGSISFNADEFKNRFNLRAPANIQIVGPLYNVERK